MPHTVAERTRRWGMDATPGADYISIYDQISYLAERRFYEYHPTIGPHPDFKSRLRDWLDNLSDEVDQKILLRLIPQIFFVGSGDFIALYRAAFRGPIMRWLVDCQKLRFPNPNLDAQFRDAIGTTWFCGISDSMQIAAFYHVNNIEGVDLRPDWRTLCRLGDADKIARYMQRRGLTRIVLLEDFVGSGSQMTNAVKFAANLPDRPPVLLAPLIIAPSGIALVKTIQRDHSNVSFAPLLSLREEAFIYENPMGSEDSLAPLVRDLAVRAYHLVSGGIPPDDKVKPYGPFGFGVDTLRAGALIVMYSNCPDNTLPLIHHRSSTWSPLFPRSTRV